jgi:hypothetical protein
MPPDVDRSDRRSDLTEYVGVLALCLGLVFGLSFDTTRQDKPRQQR